MYQAIKTPGGMTGPGAKDGESYIFFRWPGKLSGLLVEGATYLWGKAQVLQGGQRMWCSSALVRCWAKAIEAGKKLAEQGIKATVINNPFINQVDLDTIGARSSLFRPPGHDRGSSGRLRHGRPDLACPLRSGHRASYPNAGHPR